MLVGGPLTGVASTACLTDARDLTTAVPFMPLFESLRFLRADPSRRTRPTPAAVPARAALFEYETPLLPLCPFLAHRGAAERRQRHYLA